MQLSIEERLFIGTTYVYRGPYPRRGDEREHKVENPPATAAESQIGKGKGREPSIPVPDFGDAASEGDKA